MTGVMENKQTELEKELQEAYNRTIKANKRYNKLVWIKIFNKRNLKQVIKTTEYQNKIFRELREVTRENYPERFK